MKIGELSIQHCSACKEIYYQRIKLLAKGKTDEDKCPYCKKVQKKSIRYEFFNYIFD